jgi:RNA polymerase sigma-70 factor (ECF subfamily)
MQCGSVTARGPERSARASTLTMQDLPPSGPLSQACAFPSADDLLRRHSAQLFRLALCLTSNESDARDLVQDTWERSLRKLPVSLSQDRTRRWLVVTLRNRFLDLRRSKDHRGRVRLEDVAWFSMPVEDPEPEPPWANVDSAQLWRCVELLKPILREVFVLRARDRLSHAEIARRLGIPANTVATRFFRALRHLRRMLAGQVGESPSRAA